MTGIAAIACNIRAAMIDEGADEGVGAVAIAAIRDCFYVVGCSGFARRINAGVVVVT